MCVLFCLISNRGVESGEREKQKKEREREREKRFECKKGPMRDSDYDFF